MAYCMLLSLIQKNNLNLYLLIFSITFFAILPTVNASATNGAIDSTNKYAWSDVGGYINFAPTKSTISITDSALSGYIWSENDGWINLSPPTGGVANNNNGILSGSAWNPLKGWISFSGVTIDSSGKFHGKAVGSKETISFDCTYCDVRTDWRPASTRIANATLISNPTKAPISAGGGFGYIKPFPFKKTPTIKKQATSTVVILPIKTITTRPKKKKTLPTTTKHTVINTPNLSINQQTKKKKAVHPIILISTSSSPIQIKVQTTTPLRTELYIGGGVIILLIVFFIIRILFV